MLWKKIDAKNGRGLMNWSVTLIVTSSLSKSKLLNPNKLLSLGSYIGRQLSRESAHSAHPALSMWSLDLVGHACLVQVSCSTHKKVQIGGQLLKHIKRKETIVSLTSKKPTRSRGAEEQGSKEAIAEGNQFLERWLICLNPFLFHFFPFISHLYL